MRLEESIRQELLSIKPSKGIEKRILDRIAETSTPINKVFNFTGFIQTDQGKNLQDDASSTELNSRERSRRGNRKM